MNKEGNIGKKNRLMQYVVLVIALMMIVSSGVYATIFMNDDVGIYNELGVNLFRSEYSYILSTDGTYYILHNGSNGKMVERSLNCSSVMNNASNLIGSLDDSGSLFVTSGNYVLYDTVYLANSMSLTGCGRNHNYGTRFFLGDDANCTMFNLTNYNTLCNLMFNGNSGRNTVGYGIISYGASHLIKDIVMFDCAQDGIYLNEMYETTIYGCQIKGNKGNGIYSPGGGGIISNCIIDENGKCGINLSSASYITITGCDIKENLGYGVDLYRGNTLVGNTFNNNGGANDAGVYVTGFYNTITGNSFRGSTYGISFSSSHRWSTVSGNSFYEVTPYLNVQRKEYNIYDCISYNQGIPGVSDEWATRYQEGIFVWDLGNSTLYLAANGSWHEIQLV